MGGCGCDEDNNWRNEQLSLPDLEYVEISGFSAVHHEVDFLKLLFASAPRMNRMDIKLSAKVSQYLRLWCIVDENASVNCNVYEESGDRISFPA